MLRSFVFLATAGLLEVAAGIKRIKGKKFCEPAATMATKQKNHVSQLSYSLYVCFYFVKIPIPSVFRLFPFFSSFLLNNSALEQNVKNSMEYWFIKFYSPMCSHCHVMSTNWRQLAQELNAVIKVAAVNCEEDWVL
jgi:hypothetical protein